MAERTIINLIEDLRKEQKISRNSLCEGLCAPLAYSKMMSGENMLDILVVDRFLQRLGKSPDMFEVLLSDDEYDEMLERDEIENAVDNEDFADAEKRLEVYCNKSNKRNSIQQQYYYQIKAVVEKCKGNHKECIAYLKKAISCTLPNFNMEQKRNILLCVTEIELLIMLADEYFEVEKVSDAETLLEFLISYMEENYTDTIELVKIYPKAVYLQAIHIENDVTRMLCLSRCENAFQYMIREGTIIFLGEIIQVLISIYRNLHAGNKAIRLEKQLKSLEEVYEEEGFQLYASKSNMGWFKESLRRDYYLCSEIIRGQRLALGMSQEELAEGIYGSPENLARVEAGKQMPSQKNLTLLMEKLGLCMGRYNSYLVTDDYAVLEQRKKINDLIGRKEKEDAKIELEKFKLLLDTNNPINRQYIESEGTYLDYKLKIIDAEEVYQKSLQALEITYITDEEKMLRIPVKQEGRILNQLAISMWEQGQKEQGTELFRRVDERYEDSKIQLKHQLHGRGSILRNYVKALEELNRIEEAAQVCEKAFRLDLTAGKGGSLDFLLSEKLCIFEQTKIEEEKKKKAVIKYLCQAFYLSDLFNNKENNARCDAYYKKKIGSDMEWY